MTVPTGYRPRRFEEHLRLAGALTRAPARVAVEHADDGWACAHLAVCGRAPVWASRADPRPVERALLRLGLPPLSEGPAEAQLTHDLRLKGRARTRMLRGGPVHDLDLVTTVSGDWHQVRDHVRAVQSHGRLIVADRTGDPDVHAILARVPGLVRIDCPGWCTEQSLLAALEATGDDPVLLVPEDVRLLPGAPSVLLRALGRRPEPGLALGDQLLLDADGAMPTGLLPAARRTEHDGDAIIGGLGQNLPPILFSAALLRDGPPLASAPDLVTWLRALAADAPTHVAPVWTAGRVRTHAGRTHRVAPSLALVPPDEGPVVVVDDGDDGALGETLSRLPHGARVVVLRAVPDAVDRCSAEGGGFGDLADCASMPGPWRLRLTSDPRWTPPPLDDPAALVSLGVDLPDGVHIVAAMADWPLPMGRRAAGRARHSAVARLALDARRARDDANRGLARSLGRALEDELPGWDPAAAFVEGLDRAA